MLKNVPLVGRLWKLMVFAIEQALLSYGMKTGRIHHFNLHDFLVAPSSVSNKMMTLSSLNSLKTWLIWNISVLTYIVAPTYNSCPTRNSLQCTPKSSTRTLLRQTSIAMWNVYYINGKSVLVSPSPVPRLNSQNPRTTSPDSDSIKQQRTHRFQFPLALPQPPQHFLSRVPISVSFPLPKFPTARAIAWEMRPYKIFGNLPIIALEPCETLLIIARPWNWNWNWNCRIG